MKALLILALLGGWGCKAPRPTTHLAGDELIQGGGGPRNGKNVVLVVGGSNDRYYQMAQGDKRRIKKFFEEEVPGDFLVVGTIDSIPDVNTIKQQAREAAILAGDDGTLIFYYSGHGSKGYHLQVLNGGLEVVTQEWRKVRTKPFKNLYYLIDACYSGYFVEGSQQDRRAVFQLHDDQSTCDQTCSSEAWTGNILNLSGPQPETAGFGLEDAGLTGPLGERIFAMSATSVEVGSNYDPESGYKGSIFTNSFLEAYQKITQRGQGGDFEEWGKLTTEASIRKGNKHRFQMHTPRWEARPPDILKAKLSLQTLAGEAGTAVLPTAAGIPPESPPQSLPEPAEPNAPVPTAPTGQDALPDLEELRHRLKPVVEYGQRGAGKVSFSFKIAGTAGDLAHIVDVTYQVHATYGRHAVNSQSDGEDGFRSITYTTASRGWTTGGVTIRVRTRAGTQSLSYPGQVIDW